jgi:predicted transcriptional regulator
MRDQRLMEVFEPQRELPHPAVVWYGERTRIRRERAGLSQAGLAHGVGVSQSTISRIENALMPRASMTTIARIEQTLESVERHRWA